MLATGLTLGPGTLGDRPRRFRVQRPAESTPSRHRHDVTWNRYLERIAAGDSQALAALYDESRTLVYGLTLRILANSAEAEEVTLEVYLQVWQAADSFDPSRGDPVSWLVLLARSRAIDRLRGRGHRQRQRELPLEALVGPSVRNQDSPEESAWLGERRQIVRAALSTLPPEQRQAIELAFYLGLTHVELAAQLGLPLGTVKTHIRRGLFKLREQLSMLIDFPARNRLGHNDSTARKQAAPGEQDDPDERCELGGGRPEPTTKLIGVAAASSCIRLRKSSV